MSKAAIMIGLLALGTSGGLFWQQRQDHQALEELRAALPRLRPPTDEAPRQLALLARGLLTPPPVAPPPSAAPAAPPPSAAPAPAAPPAPQATFADLVGQVESRFQRAAPDAVLAANTRTLVDRELTPQLPDRGNLRSVDCRGALCRVDLVFDSRQQQERYLAGKLDVGAFWHGPFLSLPEVESADGAARSVIFLGQGDRPLLAPEAM